MISQVKVTANEAGRVVIASENNPAYGYIRVEQERAVTDENGWIRVKTLTALIPGTVSDLNKLGWVAGQVVPGTIVIREQLTPFNKRNPERDIKIAGSTGIVCKVGDAPIYRNTFYHHNTDAQDVLVAHTNVNEIKETYAVTEGFQEEEESDDFSLDGK